MRSARRTGSDPPAHDRQDSRVIHRFEAKVACSTAHRGAVWTAEDDAVHVRDAATGCARSPAPVYQKPGVTVHALLRLTTGGVWCGLDDGYIVIVDCETYQEISSFRQHNGAVLAFGQSAVGEKLVYSGGADWKVYEWTSERDEEGRAGLLRMFHSHSNSIRAIEVTDGGFLVSASSDNTVRVWDLGADDTADQSECFARLDSHDGAVKALAIQQWRDPPPPTADFSSRAQALGLTSGDPVPAGAQLETPSKCLIWSADETGTLCLWGLDAIVERRAASPVGRAVGAVPLLALRDAHSGAVARLAAFGERQVWSCGQDGKVLCWAVEWEGGEAEPVVTLVRNLASPGRLTSMQLCGRYVIQKLWVCSAAARGGGGAEGTVTAWNVEVPAHEAPDGQATHTQLDDVLLRWNEQRPAAADPTITTNYPPGGCSREEADRLRAEVQQLRRELSEAGGRQQQQQQQQKESSSRESDRTRDEKKLQAAESAVAELRRELAEARRAPGRAGGGPSAVDQDILRRLEELRKENEWLQKNAKELVAAKTKTCELLRLDVARLANELGMRDEDDKRRESASLSRSARRSASGGVDLEDLERQNQDLARTVLNLRDGLRDTSDELRDTADELQQTKRALHDAKRGGNHPSPMSRSSSGGLVGQQQQRSASVLESQLQDLMLAVEDKTDEVQHLRSVIRKQQNDAAHRMSPGSHRDTGSIRDALDDSQDAVAKQHRTIAQLEDRINNLHGLLDDERRANGELQEEVNNQAVAVENVTADNKSLVALLGNAREDAENQRTVVGSLKDILVERNKSIDLLREVVQERTQQIEALEEDLRSAQLRHEMSDGDRRSGFELTDKLEQARDELVAKRAQVERLHAEVNQLYAERDATEEKLALAHAKERQVAQLEAEIADLRDRQLQADTDVEKGMAAIEECSRLRQALLEKESEVDHLVAALDKSVEASKPVQKIAALEQENAELLRDNQTLAAHQDQLQARVREAEVAMEERAAGGVAEAAMEDRYRQVKRQLGDARARIADLEDQLAGRAPRDRSRALEAALETHEAAAEHAEKANRHLSAVVGTLEASLIDLQQENDSLRSRLAADGGQPAPPQHPQPTSALRTLEREAEQTEAKLRSALTRCTELSLRVQALESTHAAEDESYTNLLIDLLHRGKTATDRLQQALDSKEVALNGAHAVIGSLQHQQHSADPVRSSVDVLDRARGADGPTAVIDEMMAEIVLLRAEARSLRLRSRELLAGQAWPEPAAATIAELTADLNRQDAALSQREALIDAMQLKLATMPTFEGEDDEDAERRMAQLTADIDDLQASRAQAMAQLVVKQRHLDSAADRVAALEGRVDAANHTTELLKQLLEEKADALNLLKRQLAIGADEDPADEPAKDLDAVISLLESHDDALKILNVHTGREMKALEWNLREVTEACKEKDLALVDMQKSRHLNGQEIAGLKAEVQQAARALEAERAKRRDMEHEMIRFTGTITAAHSNIDELRRQLDERGRDLHVAEETAQRIEDAARRHGVHDVDTIKHDLKSKSNRLAELQRENEDLQKTVGDLEDLEEELKSTVSAQKSDLLMLQRAYDDKNAELEDLLETHAEAVSRIDQLENGVKSLREGRHESDSALLEVENRASLWEKLNHEQASTSELAKQALAEKVSAIDLLRETVEDLQGRLDRSESALKQKDAALNRQLEKASDLSRRFDTLESDHRRREDLVRQTADRLAAAEDTIQRLDAQRVDAETDLAKKVQSVRSLEQAVEQLRVRNRTLTDERVSLLASIGEKDTEPGPPANTPGALRPSALAAKLSQSLLHEQRAADSLREERDQLLGEITGLKGTAARLDRELSHARDLASLAESATGRAAAVEKDGSRRFEVCQARAAELEAAKDEILADRDAVAADLFRAEAAVKKLNGERAEVATLLQKAVAKHHAHVTPPPPREGAGGPSLADMARALVQAAAADNRVAGVAEPLQRLCAVLGVGQEQGRSDDGYQSDLALLVNGCGAQVEQLLSELQRVEAMLEKAQTVSLVEKEKRKAMVDDLQAARMETEDLKDGLAGVAATCRDRLEEATARILGVGEAVPKARGTADTIAQLLQATQQHLIAVLAPLLSAASPAKQQQQHGPPAPSTRHGKGSSSFHSIQPDAREDFEPQPITVPKPRKKSKQPKEKRRKPS